MQFDPGGGGMRLDFLHLEVDDVQRHVAQLQGFESSGSKQFPAEALHLDKLRIRREAALVEGHHIGRPFGVPYLNSCSTLQASPVRLPPELSVEMLDDRAEQLPGS